MVSFTELRNLFILERRIERRFNKANPKATITVNKIIKQMNKLDAKIQNAKNLMPSHFGKHAGIDIVRTAQIQLKPVLINRSA